MASPTSTLPVRRRTDMTDEEPPSEDVSEVTRLLLERLQAWKHACGYIEDYIEQTQSVHEKQSKEYEKVLKTVNNPLKEGEHFSQQLGGTAELFDHIRTNTQGLSNSHSETAKSLKSAVLPVFERLHNEIKSKNKELRKGVGKSSKSVDKARQETQKHIELLAQHSASYDSPLSGKADPTKDPHVIQKGVYHRLSKQIQEENSTRQDTLAVQNQFSEFESYVVKTLSSGFTQFMNTVGAQADKDKELYMGMTMKSNSQDPLFEWNQFLQRNSDVLIDPSAPQRTLAGATFPNQDHQSTKPLIQGSLERKSGMLKKYDSGFYAVTPSRWLHQFASDDVVGKDPSPELSLYLPDCAIGGINGQIFSVKGKDVSGGKLGAAVAQNKEYEFRAHAARDAETWWGIIKGMTGRGEGSLPTSPVSPSSPSSAGGLDTKLAQNTSPTATEKAATPASATAPTQGAAAKDFAGADPVSTTSPTGAGGTAHHG